MSINEVVNLEEYLMKLQEAADEIATERNVRKITVFHLHGGNFGCARTGEQLCIPLLEEAQAKVNEKYELKLEA
jgi:hypothetical protein